MKTQIQSGFLITVLCLASIHCFNVKHAIGNSDIPPTYNISKEWDLVYGKGEDVDLKLNLARPLNGKGPFPALIFLFGGGYEKGFKEVWTEEIKEAAKRGYVAAAIDYRLTSVRDESGQPKYPFPAQLQDAKCAVRWLRANADKYNIDVNRIGVMGFSAGGNLALMLGLTDSSHGFEGGCGDIKISSRVQAIVNLDGFTNSELYYPIRSYFIEPWLGGTPEQEPERYKNSSPTMYGSADDPPVLSICGALSKAILSQVELLDEKMKEVGAYHKLIVRENVGHARMALMNFKGGVSPIWEFLDKYLKNE